MDSEKLDCVVYRLLPEQCYSFHSPITDTLKRKGSAVLELDQQSDAIIANHAKSCFKNEDFVLVISVESSNSPENFRPLLLELKKTKSTGRIYLIGSHPLMEKFLTPLKHHTIKKLSTTEEFIEHYS